MSAFYTALEGEFDKPVTRTALVIKAGEAEKKVETYGFVGSQGTFLEGQVLGPPAPEPGQPAPPRSTTLFIFMHPSSTLQLMPLPEALARRGWDVLCAGSRYPKNDSALVMEKVVIDMATWVQWAKEEAGYDKVVLVGWSGGGSLSLLYQAEAEDPQITATPSGDPVDVVGRKPIPADAVIFIAAHLSRAETLTEWMDPSVIDESDPDTRDRELDIYAPDAVHTPPYSADFVEEFRAAQRARSHKISQWAFAELDRLEKSPGLEYERPFVVPRTMCDVRWLDTTIDPNDRKPDWCYLGNPREVNVGPVGMARFTTLRTWLSQWSFEHSVAVSHRNAPRIKKTPVLQIENSADDAVPAPHNSIVRGLLGTDDKEYHLIKGATHYYRGQQAELQECLETVESWCDRLGYARPGA